jgi:hypothetical protein
MGMETRGVVNVGCFTEGQRHFLEFHRNAVLLQSAANQRRKVGGRAPGGVPVEAQ